MQLPGGFPFSLPGFPSLPGITPNMMLPGMPGLPSAGIPGLHQPRTVEATKASRHHTHQNQAKKRDRLDTRAVEEEKEDAPPVLESPALLSLLDEQKRVESLVSQRRTDIRDSFKSMDRHRRKIRVTVTNTHANQQPPQPQASVSPVPSEPPSWTLAIHGRILDASDPSGALVLAPGASPPTMQTLSPHGQLITTCPTPLSSIPRGHFSDYVRRIEVQLEPALYPGEQGKAVWDKSLKGSLSKDMFEVRRTGSQPSTAKITIWIDWQPERFKLPLPLATALGTHFETRPRVLQLMAQYVAKNHLLDPKNPGSVRLPLSLAQLLAPDELKQQQEQQQQPQGPHITGALLTYETLMERVAHKLEAMPPVEITHNILLSGPPRAEHAIDLELDFGAAPLGSPLPDGSQGHRSGVPGFKQEGTARPNEKELLLLLEEAGQKKETVAADLSKAERLYHEAKRRRTALLGFVQAPVDFINGLAAAQAKELHVSRGQEKAIAYTLHNIQQSRFPGVNPFDGMYHTNASMYATEFECKRRNALFQEPWVEDCILADKVYLSNKTQRSQPPLPMGGPPAML